MLDEYGYPVVDHIEVAKRAIRQRANLECALVSRLSETADIAKLVFLYDRILDTTDTIHRELCRASSKQIEINIEDVYEIATKQYKSADMKLFKSKRVIDRLRKRANVEKKALNCKEHSDKANDIIDDVQQIQCELFLLYGLTPAMRNQILDYKKQKQLTDTVKKAQNRVKAQNRTFVRFRIKRQK